MSTVPTRIKYQGQIYKLAATNRLGTRWQWTAHPDPQGGPGMVYAIELPPKHPSNALAFRVAPHPDDKSKWTCDRHAYLTWETFIDGPFATPQAAAQACEQAFKQHNWPKP
jgi:hypothetical protein